MIESTRALAQIEMYWAKARSEILAFIPGLKAGVIKNPAIFQIPEVDSICYKSKFGFIQLPEILN